MSHYRPYPAYRASGVEWLGNVPEHWGVKAIRWLSPVQRGASPRPIDDPKYFDDEAGEYGWVRIEDVSSSNGTLKETKQRLSQLGASLSVKLQPGALFLSIAGTVGKPCLMAVKGLHPRWLRVLSAPQYRADVAIQGVREQKSFRWAGEAGYSVEPQYRNGRVD